MDEGKNLYLKYWSNFILSVVIIILFIVSIVVGVKIHNAHADYNVTASQLDAKRSKVMPVISDNNSAHFVVDAKGDPSNAAQDMNSYLNTTFNDLFTYKDVSGYNANRKEARAAIKDKSFFKYYLPAQTDITGSSMLDTVSAPKSKVESVDSYVSSDRTYYVIVSFVKYTHDSDLDQENSLVRSYAAFKVIGTPHNLTTVQTIRGFGNDN